MKSETCVGPWESFSEVKGIVIDSHRHLPHPYPYDHPASGHEARHLIHSDVPFIALLMDMELKNSSGIEALDSLRHVVVPTWSLEFEILKDFKSSSSSSVEYSTATRSVSGSGADFLSQAIPLPQMPPPQLWNFLRPLRLQQIHV